MILSRLCCDTAVCIGCSHWFATARAVTASSHCTFWRHGLRCQMQASNKSINGAALPAPAALAAATFSAESLRFLCCLPSNAPPPVRMLSCCAVPCASTQRRSTICEYYVNVCQSTKIMEHCCCLSAGTHSLCSCWLLKFKLACIITTICTLLCVKPCQCGQHTPY